MAKAYIGGRIGSAQSFNTTTYYTIGGANNSATEDLMKVKYNVAGVFSYLQIIIDANTIATSASTFRLRVNNADVNLTISIAAGTSGKFEDVANTDTISASDGCNIKCTTPNTSGSLTLGSGCIIFNATTNTFFRLLNNGWGLSTASSTRYSILHGAGAVSTTESLMTAIMEATYTGQNLAVYISSNPRTTTTTYRTRKNSANGGMSVSVTTGATGLFEDNSNTDSLVSTDTYNYQIVTGTGTGNIVNSYMSVGMVSSASKSMTMAGSAGGTGVNANVTTYFNIGGTGIASTTETNRALKAGETFTLSNMSMKVSANTASVTTTVTMRVELAAVTQVLSIATTLTGTFEDTTHTDNVVASDRFDYEVAVPAGSGTITFRHIAMLFTTSSTAIKTILGLTKASVKTVDALAIASVKTFDGLA